MVASIGPFWDANETWLVLGVGMLLVAFPAAHGVVLGALYLPVVAMLIGLMLRGVAFEFRVKAEGWHRELWNWLFWFGSFLASLRAGLMLGRYITGFESGFGYLLFALVVGAGLCGGYVLLGATWLVLQDRGHAAAQGARPGRAGACCGSRSAWALVSLATPLVSETVRDEMVRFPAHARADAAAGGERRGRRARVWRSTGRFVRGERRRATGNPSPARWRSSRSPSSASPTACSPTS